MIGYDSTIRHEGGGILTLRGMKPAGNQEGIERNRDKYSLCIKILNIICLTNKPIQLVKTLYLKQKYTNETV